jgi:hypothetical protein
MGYLKLSNHPIIKSIRIKFKTSMNHKEVTICNLTLSIIDNLHKATTPVSIQTATKVQVNTYLQLFNPVETLRKWSFQMQIVELSDIVKTCGHLMLNIRITFWCLKTKWTNRTKTTKKFGRWQIQVLSSSKCLDSSAVSTSLRLWIILKNKHRVIIITGCNRVMELKLWSIRVISMVFPSMTNTKVLSNKKLL